MAKAIETEAEIIAKLYDRWDRSQKHWEFFHRQMYKNLAFLMGKQYVIWDVATSKLVDVSTLFRSKKKVRVVFNHIFPIIRDHLSTFIAMKPILGATAMTKADTDISKAKISDKAFQWLWQHFLMDKDIIEMGAYILTTGLVWAMPYWNPNVGESFEEYETTTEETPLPQWEDEEKKVQKLNAEGGKVWHVPDKDGRAKVDKYRLGDIENVIYSPFEVMPDTLAKGDENELRYIFIKQIKTPEWVFDNYGLEVKGGQVKMSGLEQQLMNLFREQPSEIEDAVEVKEYYEKPGNKYPEGRWITQIDDKIVDKDMDIPEELRNERDWCPLVPFKVGALPPGRFVPMAIIEVLEPIQKLFNMENSTIAKHLKIAPKFLIPIGSGINEDKLTAEEGEKIFFSPIAGVGPSVVNPPSRGMDIWRHIDLLKMEFQDIGAQHDVSMAKVPAGVKCVTPDTECLTREGFKKYDKLKVGEDIYTVNPKTLQAEWKPLKKIYTYEYSGELISIEGIHLSACVTPNHKWLIRKWFGGYKHSFVETKDFKNGHSILLSAEPSDYEGQLPYYSDEFVELVGWVVTEGTYSDHNKVVISQSVKVNPKKVKRIEALLGKKYWKIYTKKTDSVRFGFANELGKKIKHLFPDKTLTYEFVNLLTHHQLRILKDALIAGDGNIRNGRYERFFNTDKNLVEIFQYVCILLGENCSINKCERSKKNKKWKDYWECQVKKSKYAAPFNTDRHKEGKQYQFENVSYKGIVWCPNTENGTFFAKRNGKVYVTGNSGKAIGYLQDQDIKQQGPTMTLFGISLSRWGMKCLKIINKKYEETRLVTMLGEENKEEIFEFKGSDITLNCSLSVNMESALPRSKAARDADIDEMADKGWIDPRQAMKLKRVPETEHLWKQIELDERQAYFENNEMSNGDVHIPAHWHNHQVHLMIHNEVRKKPEYLNDDETPVDVRKIYEKHCAVHEKFIQKLAQQAAMAAQPKPPGAGGR